MSQVISVLFFIAFCVVISLAISWVTKKQDYEVIKPDVVRLDRYQVEKFVRSFKEAK